MFNLEFKHFKIFNFYDESEGDPLLLIKLPEYDTLVSKHVGVGT